MFTGRVDMSGLQAQHRKLLDNSKRPFAQVINQTGLNVIGRAFNDTPRADKNRMQAQLGQFVKSNRINKKGKIVTVTRLVTVRGTDSEAPRLALIINARRAKAGLPGLYGTAMKKAISKTLKLRIFSSGFEAIGWIPGIRLMADALPRPFMIARMKGVAAVGRPKGGAKPANESSWKPSAEVLNNVKNIDKIGTEPLQRAVNEEEKEIARHLEEKMKAQEKAFNDASKK